jgi:hypothetical protein
VILNCEPFSCFYIITLNSYRWPMPGLFCPVLQLLLSFSCFVRLQSTHRVAMATFSRTLHHDGKITLAWWGGGGMHAHSLSLDLSSRAKLFCMYAPAKRADTLPLFLLYTYTVCTLWLDSPDSMYSTYNSDITMLLSL